MLERDLRIINPLGLHARAAAKLVRCAVAYRSSVSLVRDGSTADAKSILSVLALAAAFGTTVRVTVDGPDAEAAMKDIAVLFLSGFGEI